MPTVAEKVFAGPKKLNETLTAAQAEDLFFNFCQFAQSASWKYVARGGKVTDKTAAAIADQNANTTTYLDCAKIADVFVELAKRKGLEAKRVASADAGTWATEADTKCFDKKVVGNVRMEKGNCKAVGRCVFSNHFFTEVAGASYYDPCLLTTHAGKRIASWHFVDAYGAYWNNAFKIKEDENFVAVATKKKQPGFLRTFTLYPVEKISAEEYKAAFREDHPRPKLISKNTVNLKKLCGVK
ncbi:MAG TPA: hypothetical protein VMW16_03270 [Sedimentisphaerales bacterium]|nr:hypothetical protein [Sedimentisphaerales bacterium]